MTPFLLIPGLNCDARVYGPASTVLWPLGPVMIANPLEGEGIAAIAQRDSGRCAAALCAGRLFVRRVPGLRNPAAGARAGDETGADRYLGAARHCRGDRDSAAADRTGAGRQVRHGDRAVVSGLGASRQCRATRELYSIHRAMAGANGPEVYVRHQEAIIGRPDSRPDARHDQSADIGAGRGGRSDHAARRRRARCTTGIAGSKLVVIARAGHLALLEQPDLGECGAARSGPPRKPRSRQFRSN